MVVVMAPSMTHAGTIECDAGVEGDLGTAETFKCGNYVYVCPVVTQICSVQESTKSVYYHITQDECDEMKKVAIDSKCVSLAHYGATGPTKDLSNRVCYDDDNNKDGMKTDNEESDSVCNESILIEDITFENDRQEEPEVVEAVTEEPQAVVEAVTDPPVTDPPVTDPPVTDPPATDPPATDPPITTCPGDMNLYAQVGVTAEPDGGTMTIIEQTTSTVTVELNQDWTLDNMSIDYIYYQYKESIWSSKCFEMDTVAGGGTIYDTVTIACNVLTPYAYMEVCIVDDTILITDEDNATVPQCCHSAAPVDTPTVCYSYEISCVNTCDGDVSSGRKLLRGGN